MDLQSKTPLAGTNAKPAKSKSIFRTFRIAAIAVFLLFVLIFPNCMYTVAEDQVATFKSWGVIKMAIVNAQDAEQVKLDLTEKGLTSIKVSTEKGLHWKMPIKDSVDIYTSKYLTYVSSEETVNTVDRKKIDIQMYSQHRVFNPVFVTMKGYNEADWNKLQDDRVYPAVIQAANQLSFIDFFDKDKVESILDQRTKELSQELEKEYGMAVVDIGLFRKSFPNANISSIVDKMVKDIKKDSEKLRAEGDAQYNKDVSTAEREKAEKVAQGQIEAANIKAQADKEALAIYQKSLQKDIEFYRFMQRMNTYKEMKDMTIFVDKNSEFFDYINGYK